MTVNIKGTMRRDAQENNGLTAIEDRMIEDALERHLAVVLVEPHRVTHNVADDTTTVVVQVINIEPMLTDADQKAARELLDAARKARTGRGVEPTLTDAVESAGETAT